LYAAVRSPDGGRCGRTLPPHPEGEQAIRRPAGKPYRQSRTTAASAVISKTAGMM
jgi:hypothetical protein